MDVRHHEAFGTLLRRYREAAGLSQERLAERAGLSLRGISDLERGARTSPRLETVGMLADGLGLDAAARSALLAARGARRTARRAPDLPLPVTSFFGRESEIETIETMLRSEGARLVTLIGPGGVGKTRIALEVAHRLAADYADGVRFVDLTPVRSAALVLPVIAARLGVPEARGRRLIESLSVALGDREILVLLDNIEQVVDGAVDIAGLLAACPGVTILATSRVVLRISAEHVLPIDPLPVPEDDTIAAASLAEIPGVALFVARAHAADARFELSEVNTRAVANVVTRLEGLPLAIELAAARIRLLGPRMLAERLEPQLPLLGSGSRDAPRRQQTMRDTIAWSYDLLTSGEQVVLRCLAIFPGGFTAEAAEALFTTASEPAREAVPAILASLVDSSLLKRREGSESQVRYVMLESVREYGLEQLRAHGEDVPVHAKAHTDWYMPLARRAEFLLGKPDAATWLRRVDAEYQNLRGHIAWLIDRSRFEDALDISGSLASFRGMRGFYDEGRRELKMLLARPENGARTATRAKATVGLGILCAQQGDPVALETLQAGAEIAREAGERRCLALALTSSAMPLLSMSRLEEAEAVIKQGREIAVALDDKPLIAAETQMLGLIAAQRGQRETARCLIDESLSIFRSIDDHWGAALGELNVAERLLEEGEIDRAEELVLDAQRLMTDLGDRRDLPALYEMLADIARQRGDLPKAATLLEEALAVGHDIGDSRSIAFSLSGLARIAHLQGDDATALSLNHDALGWFERNGDIVGAMQCVDSIADIAIASGDAARAAWCAGAVDRALAEFGVARHERVPGEHQARVDAARSQLGDDEWRAQWERGHALTPEQILAEIRACQPGG